MFKSLHTIAVGLLSLVMPSQVGKNEEQLCTVLALVAVSQETNSTS